MAREGGGGREFGNAPHHRRSMVENVREGLTTTGNQRLQPRDMMSDRGRPTKGEIGPQGKDWRNKNREWGRGGETREALTNNYVKVSWKTGKSSVSRNKMRRKNTFRTLDAHPISKTAIERRRRDHMMLGGYRGAI